MTRPNYCGNCDQLWPCECDDPWLICGHCDGVVDGLLEDGGCSCNLPYYDDDFSYDNWKDSQLERDI